MHAQYLSFTQLQINKQQYVKTDVTVTYPVNRFLDMTIF